jgi:hypothetical protein
LTASAFPRRHLSTTASRAGISAPGRPAKSVLFYPSINREAVTLSTANDRTATQGVIVRDDPELGTLSIERARCRPEYDREAPVQDAKRL